MLELINDLSLGTDVVLLSDIEERSSAFSNHNGKSLFIEEEYANFDHIDSFINNHCYFSLISQVPHMDYCAWAIFNTSGITLKETETDRKVHGKLAFTIQSFRLELNDDVGYFQLICLPEKVIYDDCVFDRFDLLTFMVYRNRKVMRSVPTPYLVTLRPFLKQTFVPLVEGQRLQLITVEEEGIEIFGDGLKEVQGTSRFFSVNKSNYISKLKSNTFDYSHSSNLMLSVGSDIISFPEIDSENYIALFEPNDNTAIYAEGIDGVKIECCQESLWNWDDSNLIVKSMVDGLDISLKKPANSICVELDGEIRWAFTSKNIIGKI